MRTSSSPNRKIRTSPLRGIGRPLDAIAAEVIELCAWTVAQCGYSPTASLRQWRETCKKIPRTVIRKGLGVDPRYDVAIHLLTLWSENPDCLLPDGEFRPLPERGPAPSIESLVHALGGEVTIEHAMRI